MYRSSSHRSHPTRPIPPTEYIFLCNPHLYSTIVDHKRVANEVLRLYDRRGGSVWHRPGLNGTNYSDKNENQWHCLDCNYVGLVKCFINILDEWAWTLYELKDNVVTITSDQCIHLKELDKCIKEAIT
ncbi:hypothetical protein ANCDUO_07370 [Ancylostoma duodenale]|uniref:Uncharacterized protein n=1 Tax=Ancylostoma duodenale TaxID=51022 RepID=A0A0C2DIQ0_9BILA|nr:hypothetical protein ANCDUO_07370 [Ancylostoma duodenale]